MKLILRAALLASACLASAARADTPIGDRTVSGAVVKHRGCGNYIFVFASGETGYAMLERVGGAEVLDDDVLKGELEKSEIVEVLDTATNEKVIVYGVEAFLSEAEYRREAARYCR